MKITAEFDSVNSADMAAAAIRQQVSPFSDIKVTEYRSQKNFTSNKGMLVFSSNNPSYNPGYNSFPVVFSNTADDFNETDLRSGAVLEATFIKEEERRISNIIVNHGGREIRTFR
ncbi:MAG: hypothetical protein ACI4J6_04695 [Oscillospiraceae bacterium]